jgi:hypothetical protein
MPPRSATPKPRASAPGGNFQIDTMSAKDAHDTLRHLRSGRGGRTSKYQPILDGLRDLKKGELLRVGGVGRMEVNALKAYLFRYIDRDAYKVKSAREKDAETFTVVAGKSEDFDR